nr:CarD family transcriptional regulator [uncultured Blautia sp.]
MNPEPFGGGDLYQVGDCVVKENTGLCRITDIVHLEGMDVDRNKKYYLLVPHSDDKMKIYVPVDSIASNLRKAIECNEAWSVIENITKIDAVHIENEKQREQKYKEAIKSCDPEQWISIIKTMYFRKQKRNIQGKKNTAMDERYFKLAEKYLYSELAYAIGKDESEMCQLIADTIKKKDMKAEKSALI